jgi:putative spermidine/putrescine transport system permease protein
MEGRLSGGTAWLVYGITACVMVFVMAPLLVAISISFSAAPFASFPPQGFTLDWYRQVLVDPDFIDAFTFSIGLALASTCTSIALGLPAALALQRSNMPAAPVLQGMLLSPLIFPVLITGLALLQFYSAANMQQAAVNLYIGHTLVTLPYVVRTVTASLQLVDRSLEEAARTLGADRWRTFRRVTIPQIAPGVAAGALFAFMVSLDNYPISMWLSDARAVPLPILLFQNMSRVFDPSIAAMASLMILVGAAAVVALEKLVGLRRAMGI